MTNPALPSSIRRRIIEKVSDNRLTIIVGPTGCGKSSIVPQVLLNDIGSPILVTQPRRLAVVAVASYVAKQRGVELGEEVGYHVGQDRMANNETDLVFVTAGVLLEELKAHGLNALTDYKVVVIDECHERSCESDLVLTIIKEFMIAHPRSNLRIVLMSATFNHQQYSSFFRGVPGCEYVDTIPIQTANSLDAHYDRVDTFYLDDISRMLRRSSHVHDEDCNWSDYCIDMKDNATAELSAEGKALTEEMLDFMMALVTHLHNTEPRDSIFLVFAPTYRHLEQIFNLLGVYDHFDLGVLHSSIDVEDCLKFMNSGSTFTRKRKVLLASAIADSSVTIPNVACVIDTCRSLEMKWSRSKSNYETKTVWASQAIADQRKGRTGRTCSGKVFRLVYQNFYNNYMEQWEKPKLCLASCRDEVLSLLASKNKVMDPVNLLKKTLDPPSTLVVKDAIEYLKSVGACREVIISRKRKLILTAHGEMISVLPFTVDEANTVVYGGKKGLLHEALALVAIKSARPMPILTSFGDDESNRLNLSRYFPDVEPKDQQSVAIANLAAYIFWYVHWGKIRRFQMKHHFKNCTVRSGRGVSSQFFGEYAMAHHDDLSFSVGCWTPEMDKVHSDWCHEHFINPSSVKSVTNFIEVTMRTLFRCDIDPEWLKCQPLEPAWNRDQQYPLRQNVFTSLYGKLLGREMSTKTLVQLQCQAVVTGGDQGEEANKFACIHYLNGNCSFGEACRNAHSFNAPRPPCRFHLRGGCTNDQCLYAHGEATDTISSSDRASMINPTHGKFNGGALSWLCQDSSSLLLLGKCGIERSLESMGKAAKIALGGKGSDLAHIHKNRYLMNRGITKIAWNFPVASASATDGDNELLLRAFFMAAQMYLEAEPQTSSHLEVALALQGNQFSKWNVFSSAQSANFCLEWFEEFDSAIFPGYTPHYANNEPIQIRNATFYLFRLKKNILHDPLPKTMEIRHGTKYGLELEMTSAPHLSRTYIAQALSHGNIHVENVEDSWSEAKRTSMNWKLVGDGSIECNLSQPNCNRFELVSPILHSENGLRATASLLGRLATVGVTVNRTMGFHVHIDMARYSISDIIKICQQFVKYEDAIDTMLPHSRRTGSRESNKYFNSNSKMAKKVLRKDEAGVLNALQQCSNYHDLANILNPHVPSLSSRRYFKLNLQNLTSNRQTTIEFRQHSSTSNYEKVSSWVRFIVRFCENSVSSEMPTSFANTAKSIDEQFDHLFKDIIRDSVLYSYYKERRHLLSVDEEGEACCHGCVTGQGCSK